MQKGLLKNWRVGAISSELGKTVWLRFNFYRPTPPKKGGFCVRGQLKTNEVLIGGCWVGYRKDN